MGSVIKSTLTLILSVEFIIGNLGNGFIVLVNCVDWIKRRKLSLADQILTALAISRIGLLWLMIVSWCVSVFYPALFETQEILRTLNVTWTVTNHCSIWLATSLSTLYFLKIAMFSNSVFLYLKWRIKKVILVILLVALVLLVFNIALTNILVNAWISGCRRNKTCSSGSSDYAQVTSSLLLTNTMFIFIPFTLTLTTFLLLIFSLWKHLKKMKHSVNGSRDASTKVHIKAMQTIVAFLLLYTVFFLSFFLPVWSSELLDKNMIIMFCQVIAIVYPSGHSCVLILANNKLRQTSLLVLGCRFKDSETSGHGPLTESS
ncbi:taste receptor type 2 member 14 [Carlito syrichta]|uniref:Taste receptor type 2 n=1 Tax=Carlito syrichta TaxID=1868482 RepID=A0A1U7TCK0_CARSF|nr:taste receptor type 2 member 14 [Carlito syrichta]